MKRTLGVIVFAALNTGNVAFPESWKSIFVSVRLGKFFEFGKFVKAVVALFLGHIGCGANALPFGITPPEKVALLNRIISAFQHGALHNRKNSAQVKHLGREGSYA